MLAVAVFPDVLRGSESSTCTADLLIPVEASHPLCFLVATPNSTAAGSQFPGQPVFSLRFRGRPLRENVVPPLPSLLPWGRVMGGVEGMGMEVFAMARTVFT